MNSSFACVICNTNNTGCSACTIAGSTITCTACDAGYYLDPNNSNKCIPCTAAFAVTGGNTTGFDAKAKTCTLSGTALTITACIDGYILYNSAICVNCTAS